MRSVLATTNGTLKKCGTRNTASLEIPLGQCILKRFLAASCRRHDDLACLYEGPERQIVLDHGVAGARETGETVRKKRLLHRG